MCAKKFANKNKHNHLLWVFSIIYDENHWKSFKTKQPDVNGNGGYGVIFYIRAKWKVSYKWRKNWSLLCCWNKHEHVALMTMLGTIVHTNKRIFDIYFSHIGGFSFSDMGSSIFDIAQALVQTFFLQICWTFLWPAFELTGD